MAGKTELVSIFQLAEDFKTSPVRMRDIVARAGLQRGMVINHTDFYFVRDADWARLEDELKQLNASPDVKERARGAG